MIHFSIPQNLRVLVFGGALDSNCFRDRLITHLKQEKKYLTIIPDKINYFDISSEKYNLVEKETRLFDNSDILIIIPESPGSFAEIGMLASMINNPHDKKQKFKHAKKILVITDEKFKHDESFIKLGPIKSIKHAGGHSINFDLTSNNYSKITNKFTSSDKPLRIYFDNKNANVYDLFFINCLKILIFIYSEKTIIYSENEYKSKFIDLLKNIHKSVTTDNIEYLESTELINKENRDGKIIININHTHSFIKNLIKLNQSFFINQKIFHKFLTKSSY